MTSEKIERVRLDAINVGERARRVDDDVVEQIAADVRNQGLLQPIGVVEDGGGYRLIFGAHRLEAFRLLVKTDKEFETIPARVWLRHTPDWLLQMAEFSENLRRKELSSLERAGQEARVAALLKEAGRVVPAAFARLRRTAVVDNGVTDKITEGVVRDNVPDKPTVADAVAKETGGSPDAIKMRVGRAAAEVGMREGFSLETGEPEELRRFADKVEAKAAEPKAPRPKKAPSGRKKTSAPAPAAEEAHIVIPTPKVPDPRDEEIERLASELAAAEERGAVAERLLYERDEEIARLRAQVAERDAEITRLRAQLDAAPADGAAVAPKERKKVAPVEGSDTPKTTKSGKKPPRPPEVMALIREKARAMFIAARDAGETPNISAIAKAVGDDKKNLARWLEGQGLTVKGTGQ